MKPGTPLPWVKDPNDELPLGIIEDTENGYGVCEIDGSGPVAEQNAAYIVHAANLYPELVEMLEDALSRLEEWIGADCECYEQAGLHPNQCCLCEYRALLDRCKGE